MSYLPRTALALGLSFGFLACGREPKEAVGGAVEVKVLPPGDGAVIGPDGGTIVSAAGATLNVPSGALTSEVRIGVSLSDWIPPDFFHAAGPAYVFAPEDLELAAPVTLQLPISDSSGPAVMFISRRDGTGYDLTEPPAWKAGGFLHATVSHFGTAFAAAAP
jgi:hypothetical protein